MLEFFTTENTVKCIGILIILYGLLSISRGLLLSYRDKQRNKKFRKSP